MLNSNPNDTQLTGTNQKENRIGSIIMTLAHNQLVKWEYNKIKNTNNNVVFDVKGVLPLNKVDERL